MAGDGDQAKLSNRDVARGLGAALAARLGAVIELVSQPIYVWMFGLAGYGLYAVLWSAVNLIENFADLGSTAALQRVVPQASSRRAQAAALGAALIIGVVPCAAIALLAVILAPALAAQMNVAATDRPLLVDCIRLFAWSLPLWAFVEVATSALRAQRVFGAEIRLRIFWEQLIRLILAAAFWLGGFGITGLLYAHMISLAITMLLSIRLLAGRYHLPDMIGCLGDPGTFRKTLAAGLASLPYNATSRLFSDAPAMILNLTLPGAAGATAAALYIIARKISSLVQMIRVALAYVIAPLASNAASTGDRGAIVALYAFATRLSAVIAIPVTAGLILGAPAILNLFGPGAESASHAVMILCVARAMETMGGQAAQIQQVISRLHLPLVGSLAGMVLALATGYWTVPAWGLTGIAIAVGTGLIASAAMTIHQVDRHEGMHPFDRHFRTTLGRTLLIGAGEILLGSLSSHWPRSFALPYLCALTASAVWLSLKFALSTHDKPALGRFGRMLRV